MELYQDQPHVFQAFVLIKHNIAKFALQRMGSYIHENTGYDMKLTATRSFVRIRNENGYPMDRIVNPEAIIDDGADTLVLSGIWKREGNRYYKGKGHTKNMPIEF
jgi:hypothetical protein